MSITTEHDEENRAPFGPLKFTPAEWRVLLEDRSFLEEADNSYAPERRLMGLPVQIVPDHRLG